MSEIIVRHIADDVVNDKHTYVESAFSIDGKEVIGHVDRLSENPLRMLEYELLKKRIRIDKKISGNDPWDIKELRIQSKQCEEIERLLKEIMEYRCHPEYDFEWNNIIRQLPFEVLMRTSDNIMNFGKPAEEISSDKYASKAAWRRIAAIQRAEMGIYYDGYYDSGNPNNTVDSLTISPEEPEKRIHLIYRSSRGGYNIKTQTYEDSSLDHYCYYDSHIWD